MALLVCTNNTGTNGDINTYSPLSVGDSSNPLTSGVVLDGSGGTVDSSTSSLYLVATVYNYTGISVSITVDTASIDWKVSLDGTTWADSVVVSDMNALVTDVVTPVYFKCVVLNDGTVSAQVFNSAKIRIQAVESAS